MGIRSNDTAPFRKYNKTDAQVYAEGIQSGITWPAHWDWVPGGPWVPMMDRSSRRWECPDWVEYCETLFRHNQLWCDGWKEGNEARKVNVELANKLVQLLPA